MARSRDQSTVRWIQSSPSTMRRQPSPTPHRWVKVSYDTNCRHKTEIVYSNVYKITIFITNFLNSCLARRPPWIRRHFRLDRDKIVPFDQNLTSYNGALFSLISLWLCQYYWHLLLDVYLYRHVLVAQLLDQDLLIPLNEFDQHLVSEWVSECCVVWLLVRSEWVPIFKNAPLNGNVVGLRWVSSVKSNTSIKNFLDSSTFFTNKPACWMPP